MTPDSSRFWPKEHYQVGRGQPSLDKQPIRDHLDGLPDWNKRPPPPDLPPEVVEESSRRYLEIFQRLNEENGITVAFVTRDPEIAAMTRRVVRLYDGEIVSDEPVPSPISPVSMEPLVEPQVEPVPVV